MENTDNQLEHLFRLYLENRLSPEEYRQFWTLLGSDESPDVFSGKLKDLWEQSLSTGHSLPDEMWNQKMKKARSFEESGRRSAAALLPLRRKASWWKAAAILIPLAGATVLALRIDHNPALGKAVTAGPVVSAGGQDNTSGNHKKVDLPDGSTVLLNIGSRLDYPSGFTGELREVWLTGEGYFTIRQQPGRPFIVHSGALTTKVLGTSFNIQAYPDKNKISVTVTNGKVQVLDNQKPLAVLTLNQQVVYDKSSASYEQKQVNAASLIAWTEQDLIFDNMSMEEAASLIGKRFHVLVQFSNERLKNCRVTASFLSNHGLDQVLLVLCKLTDATYSKQGNSIMLSGDGCR